MFLYPNKIRHRIEFNHSNGWRQTERWERNTAEVPPPVQQSATDPHYHVWFQKLCDVIFYLQSLCLNQRTAFCSETSPCFHFSGLSSFSFMDMSGNKLSQELHESDWENIYEHFYAVLLDWPITVRTVSVITTNNHVSQIIGDIIIRLSHSSNRSFFNFTRNSLNRTDFLLPLLTTSFRFRSHSLLKHWNTGRGGGGGGGSSLYPPSSPTESLRHASQPTS